MQPAGGSAGSRPPARGARDQNRQGGRRGDKGRQDEIGTPICLTIDFDTVETDNCVTLRHRDTMDQIRVKIDDIKNEISKMLKSF